MKFSVIGIMYNEGERLEKCLDQFKGYTDDIVIFNTESSDNTEEISRRFTDKVWTVPFVGYCDCYNWQAWLKAKYDWCFWICGDEEYTEILDWIDALDESTIEEDGISFHRKTILDGELLSYDLLSWHTRLVHRHRIWTYDLLDAPIHSCNKMLCCPEDSKYFSHIKSSEEMDIDRNNRCIASRLLAEKYKFTKLTPYVEHVTYYTNYVGREVSSKENSTVIKI